MDIISLITKNNKIKSSVNISAITVKYYILKYISFQKNVKIIILDEIVRRTAM